MTPLTIKPIHPPESHVIDDPRSPQNTLPVPSTASNPKRATPKKSAVPAARERPSVRIENDPELNHLHLPRPTGGVQLHVAVSLYPQLWEHLDDLTEGLSEIRHERIGKSTVLATILHACAPASSEEARAMVGEWYQLIADHTANPYIASRRMFRSHRFPEALWDTQKTLIRAVKREGYPKLNAADYLCALLHFHCPTSADGLSLLYRDYQLEQITNTQNLPA